MRLVASIHLSVRLHPLSQSVSVNLGAFADNLADAVDQLLILQNENGSIFG